MTKTPKLCLISALLLMVAACDKHEAPVPAAASAAPVAQPLAAYEAEVTELPPGGNCALDAVNGTPAAAATVAVGQDVVFGGWMGNAQGEVPTDARLVLASAAASYAVPVAGGVERPDVAAALGQAGLAKAGFNVGTTLGVAPGTYDTFIVHNEAAPVACPLNIALTVAG